MRGGRLTIAAMTMLTAAQCALLRTDIWFSQLPPAFALALLAIGRVRTWRGGEALFRRGDAVGGLYAVISGAVQISGVAKEGREAIVALMEPPMWFGEIALFDRLPRTHDAVADGPTTLLFIPLTALDALLDEHPGYWRHFGVLMAFKVRLAFIALEDLSIVAPAARMARRLVWLAYCAVTGGEMGRCRLAIKQTQLALMMALSRQTVNQLLQTLAQRGVIRVSYGLIDVLDMAALQDEAALTDVERRVFERAGTFPVHVV